MLEAEERITAADREVLRELGRRVAEIGALPVQEERRRLWRRHNALDRPRAMILVFPEGSWRELLPPATIECEGRRARMIEHDLKRRIYQHEHLDSDNVIEGHWTEHRVVYDTGWGVEPERVPSSSATGAWAFKPVINEPKDLERLRMPELVVDDEATGRNVAEAEELFDGVLPVRVKGRDHFSFHLMKEYTSLRGLEQVMIDMIENPAMLHEAMAFFTEGYRRVVEACAERNVLDLNNDNTYQNSGGNGWTDELPAEGFDPERVRLKDMWASAEAQELAQVSPAMHEAFALQYERRLLEPFGLTGYGCCEDLTRKLGYVTKLENMRRISIAPSADVASCAEQLGDRYVFSWKPKPQMLVGAFDPERIRAYLRDALEKTRGCVFEMVLKDTHTCEHDPERFDTWCRIAREEVERLG